MFSEREYYYKNKMFKKDNIAVPSIILSCIIIYLLQQITTVRIGYNFEYSSITYYLSLFPPKIKDLQLWRFVTYMFLHGNFWHLLINMWGLYIFGSLLEKEIGTLRFLQLYFISGIFGAIFWFLFNFNTYIPCVGASAALFGIMVGAAMLYPDVMIMLLFPPIPLKLKTFIIIYALIETFSSIMGLQSYVAHLAHIGGLISGYFFMRKFYPYSFDIFKFIFSKIPINLKQNKTYSSKTKKNWKIKNKFTTKTVDEILDKISKEGINSLSPEEIEILKQAREKMKAYNKN